MDFELFSIAPTGTKKNYSYTIKNKAGSIVKQFECSKNLIAASIDGSLQFVTEAEITGSPKTLPPVAIAYRGKQMVN